MTGGLSVRIVFISHPERQMAIPSYEWRNSETQEYLVTVRT